MRYFHFRELGLAVGSGIVESTHRHAPVNAGASSAAGAWPGFAAYRTAGARRFHRALRNALVAPPGRHAHAPLPNGPHRAKRTYALHPGSLRNKALLASMWSCAHFTQNLRELGGAALAPARVW